MSMRRLRMGLNTILGYQKQGFFIPYRYADSLPSAGNRGPYSQIDAFMKEKEPEFLSCLKSLDQYKSTFSAFGQQPPPAPRWEQDWFPRLDAAVAYGIVRSHHPTRIIEVGSGHSTRFMMQAIQDGSLSTKFTSIDPAPRATIETLPIEVVRDTVQQAPIDLFSDLRSGDILFIDSSHISMPGSDVDLLFLEILPRLPAGILIHIHDIFLPDDYPEHWDWRGYNEQQAIAPYFLGGGYDVVFSSAYVTSRMKAVFDASFISKLPIRGGAVETSLWLRKNKITDI
ncbi:class I SAM-dependent methyltransferase [Sneathiella marina]|uniref:Class I SAM-dependent methyltransferase n=1 Tax=Sneathiella marina TaxID=2950108 RepID=A0ABY4W1X8_9PROT|nr:class I SAM-dependent methyltransferase [Sneathiella marina]USG61168.1 class I SAM-dependent methyltransferase [Sneathiella marina]